MLISDRVLPNFGGFWGVLGGFGGFWRVLAARSFKIWLLQGFACRVLLAGFCLQVFACRVLLAGFCLQGFLGF